MTSDQMKDIYNFLYKYGELVAVNFDCILTISNSYKKYTTKYYKLFQDYYFIVKIKSESKYSIDKPYNVMLGR